VKETIRSVVRWIVKLAIVTMRGKPKEDIGTFETAFREEFPSAYDFRFDETGFLAKILYPDGWAWDFYEVHHRNGKFVATATGFRSEGDLTTTLDAIRARVNERGQ